MEIGCGKALRIAVYSAMFGRAPNGSVSCPSDRPGYFGELPFSFLIEVECKVKLDKTTRGTLSSPSCFSHDNESAMYSVFLDERISQHCSRHSHAGNERSDCACAGAYSRMRSISCEWRHFLSGSPPQSRTVEPVLVGPSVRTTKPVRIGWA